MLGSVTEEPYDPHRAAGETKKRRTREKLIQAADRVMRDTRGGATVEAIAEDAGVSTATFYAFFTSRNAVCSAAFVEVVLGPLESAGVGRQPFDQSVDALYKVCGEREDLVRAALIARYEDRAFYRSQELRIEHVTSFLGGLNHLVLGENADFVAQATVLLADGELLGNSDKPVPNMRGGRDLDLVWLLKSVTLKVLDGSAGKGGFNGAATARLVRPACAAVRNLARP
jgi:AcrR family transcriptional regulator